jgi:hypothetical protein
VRGSDFAAELAGTQHGGAREALILEAAIARGGIVAWLLSPVVTELGGHTFEFWAAADYFAIGEPDDYVRVPVAGSTAQALADAVGMALPTPRMVDQIWLQAAAKLPPITLPQIGGQQSHADQTSGAFYAKHSRAIDAQRLSLGAPSSGLVAGHKKDVVLCNALVLPSPNPKTPPVGNRVAIYGWHQAKPQLPCGNPATPGVCPIQGMSVIHELSYGDYSHGVRFVSPDVRVDGELRTLASVLGDPELAAAWSHEGPLKLTRYPGGGGSGGKPTAGECRGLLAGGVCPSGSGTGTVNPKAGAVALGICAAVAAGVYAWQRYA